MVNVHTVAKQVSLTTGATTLSSQFNFMKANTKALVFVYEALSNGGSQTLANVLTQLGSIVKLSTDKYGVLYNYQAVADWFYDHWRQFGRPRFKMHTTDNDVIKGTLILPFGRQGHPEEGLPACQITLSLTVPADGNSVDTRTVSVYQIIADQMPTRLIQQDYFAYTPQTSKKKQPLNAEPRSKEILDCFIFQTTAVDDSTTDTTSIEEITVYKDSEVSRLEADDILLEFYDISLIRVLGDNTIYAVDCDILGNYKVVDFTWLRDGKGLVPQELGVISEMGLNIKGGDTNAVRIYQRSLIPA